jgi:hypothetical protein
MWFFGAMNSTRLFWIFAGICIAICIPLPIQASEIHSFLMEGCRVESGIVVDVGDDEVELINLNGQGRTLPIKQIRAIFIADLFENPVSQVHLDDRLFASLLRITVGKEEFLGWPVRFVESLVMFYDVNGRLRVDERDSITRIRPVDKKPDLRVNPSTPISIDLTDLSAECRQLTFAHTNAVRPTRVLADQIKVDQYLSDLKHGYGELRNFQERTYLYARPFLFEKSNRLGFVGQSSTFERQLPAPIFFQWSSGTPFHFQSFNRIGQQTLEFSPYALAPFAFRSDLKAHLFHAQFSGDLRGLAGGQSLYKDVYSPGNADKFGGLREVQTGMNYLLMMGGDFGPISLSAGYYYPVHFLRAGDSWREVRASRRNYAYRAMWTTERLRLRVLFSPYSFDSSKAQVQDVGVNDELNELPASFNFKGKLIRGGFDLDINPSLQANFDLVSTDGEYSAGTAAGGGETFSFTRRALILSARQDFGDYVGIRLTGTWLQSHIDSSGFLNGNGSQTDTPFLMGGQLELVF